MKKDALKKESKGARVTPIVTGGVLMKEKILFVDDEVDFVEVYKVALEKKGYDVVAAYNGEDALVKASEEKPDIIVLDVMMSRKTEGFDVSRELRKRQETQDVPILMFTAMREAMEIERKINPDKEWLPVTEFMEKPVAPNKLIEKVAQLLKKKKNESKQ